MAEPAKNFEPESVRKLQTKAKLRLDDSGARENNSPVIDPSPARAKLFLEKNEASAEVDKTGSPTATTDQPPKLALVKPEQDDQVYETSGTEASNPKGESLDKKSGAGKDHADSETLSDAEKSASESSANDAAKPELTKLASATPSEDSGSLYKKTDDSTKARSRPKSLKGWAFKHQKKLFGGGIITFIVGIFMMLTFASGPLQFLHFSQLLQQFHLGNLQSAQDHRFLKQVRFWRFAANGEIEKTRLGLLGRKVAPKFETKLNASGFKSSYTSAFGNFNGYEIDRTNEKFKGKSYQEIKKLVKDQYGLDVVQGSELGNAPKEVKGGGLFIDARNLGFLDSYRLNFALLQEAGYSKLSSAIGARTLCNLAGCTLHPIKKLTTSLSRAAEEKFYAKQRATEITKAREAARLKAQGAVDKNNPAATEAAQSGAADVQSTIDSATSTGDAVSSGDTAAIGIEKSSLLKLSGKTFAVGGLVCVLQGINVSYTQKKVSQVEKPAVNTALNKVVAEAAQITSGQDMNSSQLKYDASFLTGKDSTGQQSSWINAETFQTQLGNPGKGVPASDTLKTIGTDTKPFPEVDNGFTNGFCNAFVQDFITVITFAATAGASTVLDIGSGFLQSLLTGQFIDKAAHWLSSVPIDPFSVGADLGNIANYGMHLFASWQFASLGGVTLSKSAMETQAADQKIAINDTLSRKGLLYRLFSTQDANSTIAKVIDQQNPDPIKNVARMASGIFNVKGIFGSIGNIFSSKAKADSPPTYDYGLPSYGFTDQELYGSIGNESPYDNAGKVAVLLDGPNGPDYISKAQKCFGVTIEQISTTADDGSVSQVWGVNSAKNTLVDVDKREPGCDSHINTDDWLRIRLFILDSVTMDNMACYQGDTESCNNVGIASGSPGSSTGDSTTVAAPTVTEPTPATPSPQDFTCVSTADKNQPDWAKSCSTNLPIAATDWYCNLSVGRAAMASFKCPADYALDYQTSGQHKGLMLFNYPANGNHTRQSLLYVPTKLVDAHTGSLNTLSDSVPLVIYLHGRGTDTVGSPGWYSTYGYWPVAQGGKDSAGLYPNGSPANIDKAYAAVNQYGAVMVDMQGQGRVLGDPSYAWSGQLSDIAKMPSLIKQMLPWLNIDSSRVYVMGSSMGGQESLAELSKYPETIAAAYVNDPVTDLAKQYTTLSGSSAQSEQDVANKAMVPEVGGTPTEKPADYAARSPMSMLSTAIYNKPIRLDIDQDDTTVNISQKVDYYNAIKAANVSAPIFKYTCTQITNGAVTQKAEHAYILALTKNGYNNAFGFFYNAGSWLTLNGQQTIAPGSIDCSR